MDKIMYKLTLNDKVEYIEEKLFLQLEQFYLMSGYIVEPVLELSWYDKKMKSIHLNCITEIKDVEILEQLRKRPCTVEGSVISVFKKDIEFKYIVHTISPFYVVWR